MTDYEPRRPTQAVEDYTNAFLCMAAVVVFILLIAFWAIFGYVASLLTAIFIGKGIKLLPRRE